MPASRFKMLAGHDWSSVQRHGQSSLWFLHPFPTVQEKRDNPFLNTNLEMVSSGARYESIRLVSRKGPQGIHLLSRDIKGNQVIACGAVAVGFQPTTSCSQNL